MSAKNETPQEKTGRPLSFKFAVFSLIVLGIIFTPTTVLLCGCLLPTYIAALVDQTENKIAGITVGMMNLSTSIPALLTLWRGHNGIHEAVQLLLTPETIIFSYSGAAAGWGLYYYVPPLIAAVLRRKSERRLKDIEKRQMELVRKWGEEVSK